MTYTITIQPANIAYQAEDQVTLLQAALANKLSLQHSCQKGSCGACMAEVLEGQVENELGVLVCSGTVLTCCSYAQSDVCLKANYYPELAEIECLTVPCKITTYQAVTEDIIIVTLRLPPTTVFRYLPGQYLDLIYGNVRRSYSIANAQATSTGLELHIKLLPDGEFSGILKQSCLNQLMRIEGPKGTFFVRDSDAPMIFLAGGTGFAPVKAMVENLLASGTQRMIYIYWGMSHSSGFYSDVAKRWARDVELVHYIPVVSSDEPGWQGRVGFVHQAVLDDFPNLNGYHVYACGAPAMISAAREAFIARGLDETHFYSDAFVPSNEHISVL